MTFFPMEIKELGRSIQNDTYNKRSLIRIPQVCWDILQTEEAFIVKEYKHTYTQAFITVEILKRHIKDEFEINGKQRT